MHPQYGEHTVTAPVFLFIVKLRVTSTLLNM